MWCCCIGGSGKLSTCGHWLNAPARKSSRTSSMQSRKPYLFIIHTKVSTLARFSAVACEGEKCNFVTHCLFRGGVGGGSGDFRPLSDPSRRRRRDRILSGLHSCYAIRCDELRHDRRVSLIVTEIYLQLTCSCSVSCRFFSSVFMYFSVVDRPHSHFAYYFCFRVRQAERLRLLRRRHRVQEHFSRKFEEVRTVHC